MKQEGTTLPQHHQQQEGPDELVDTGFFGAMKRLFGDEVVKPLKEDEVEILRLAGSHDLADKLSQIMTEGSEEDEDEINDEDEEEEEEEDRSEAPSVKKEKDHGNREETDNQPERVSITKMQQEMIGNDDNTPVLPQPPSDPPEQRSNPAKNKAEEKAQEMVINNPHAVAEYTVDQDDNGEEDEVDDGVASISSTSSSSSSLTYGEDWITKPVKNEGFSFLCCLPGEIY